MKKSITGVVALLAGACVAHSQATVSLANAYALSTYIYVSLGSTKLGGGSTGPAPTLLNYASEGANGNDWTVALWGGPLGSTTAQLEANGNLATSTFSTGAGTGPAGTWVTGNAGAIPGVLDGGTANADVQLAAWYNDGGTIATYAAASTAGVPVGLSSIQIANTGGPSSSGPPTTAPNLPSGLGNISLATSVIPEPSTIALGVMGASAFLLRLRKKQ